MPPMHEVTVVYIGFDPVRDEAIRLMAGDRPMDGGYLLSNGERDLTCYWHSAAQAWAYVDSVKAAFPDVKVFFNRSIC